VAIFHRQAPMMAREAAVRQARVTHGSEEAVAAAALLSEMLVAALGGDGLDAVTAAGTGSAHADLVDIAAGAYRSKARAAISSAPRARDTLEAALWCLHRARDFEAAVIEAVNLGGDTDTIGAVTGQLAGALFGTAAIPRRWLAGLHSAGRLAGLARQLHVAGPAAMVSNL